MIIDDKLADDLLAYLGTRPLKEVYGLFSRLALARNASAAQPPKTIGETTKEANDGN